MKGRRLYCLVALVCSVSLSLPEDSAAREAPAPIEKEWTNREGRKIKATITGFDADTQMVQFRLSDGSTAQVSIHQLKWHDRAFVALSDQFNQATASKGIGYPLALLLLSAAGVFTVAGFLPAYAGFHLAARLITGQKGLQLHFLGFLKLFGIGIVSLIVLIVGALILLGDGAAKPPETAGVGFVALYLAVVLITWVAATLVTMGHYDTGFLPSIGIQILGNSLGSIFLNLIVLVAFLSLTLTGTDWLESVADSVVDGVFLRPAGIVPADPAPSSG